MYMIKDVMLSRVQIITPASQIRGLSEKSYKKFAMSGFATKAAKSMRAFLLLIDRNPRMLGKLVDSVAPNQRDQVREAVVQALSTYNPMLHGASLRLELVNITRRRLLNLTHFVFLVEGGRRCVTFSCWDTERGTC